MPNLQQLKERIYALNPELKYLTMGCEVKIDSDEHPLLNENIVRYVTDYGVNGLGEIKICGYDRFIHTSCISEILGHPITLNALLIAMKLTGHEWEKVTVKGNIMNFSIPKSESVTTIEDGVGINNEQYGSVVNYEWWSVDYDLSKTFDQNIAENEELVAFLLSIIKE